MTGLAEPRRIRIRVKPSMKREAVREGKRGVLEVDVREPAEANQANVRAVALVALHIGVAAKRIRIVRGHHLRVKILEVYANKL